MDRKGIESKLQTIVMEHLGVDQQEITNDANFVDDLGADSLDTIELTMEAEEEFGIEIDDEEAEKAVTFGKAVDLIAKKLGTKK